MIKKTHKYLLAAFGFSLALVSSAQVVTTIVTSADARIDRGSPDTNVANDTLYVRDSSTTGFQEKSYLQFDLSGQLGPGETFSTSSFSLTTQVGQVTSLDGTFSIFGIVDNNDSWTEAGITWNNAPKNDTESGSAVLELGTTALGTAILDNPSSGETVVTFSGSALTEYLNWTAGAISDPYGNGASSDAIATIIVTSTGTDEVLGQFWDADVTGQSTRLPQLTVTAVPEPGTYALVAGFATLGLILLRRRRKGDPI